MITMPNADSHQSRVLQEDNTELAYEALFRLKPRAPPHDTNPYPCLPAQFARKFPGYTAENLDTKGIHEVNAYAPALRRNTTHAYASVPQVAARRFCLVAADHPLVSAVSAPPSTCAYTAQSEHASVYAHRSRRTPRSSRWARLA